MDDRRFPDTIRGRSISLDYCGRSRRQRLPEGERQEGALLEMTIKALKADNILLNSEIASQYGADETEQTVNIGLSLCLIWLNRILFIKLLVMAALFNTREAMATALLRM